MSPFSAKDQVLVACVADRTSQGEPLGVGIELLFCIVDRHTARRDIRFPRRLGCQGIAGRCLDIVDTRVLRCQRADAEDGAQDTGQQEDFP